MRSVQKAMGRDRGNCVIVGDDRVSRGMMRSE